MIYPDEYSFIKPELITTSGDDKSDYGTIEMAENGQSFLEMGITTNDEEYLFLYPTEKFIKIPLDFVKKMITHTETYIKENKAP